MVLRNQKVSNPNPSDCGRSLGVLNTAVALAWATRCGQTSSTVLGGLTNKQTPPRLIAGKLLKKTMVGNPRAPAQYALTATAAGRDYCVELIERVRSDPRLVSLAKKRGFAPIVLDPSMPPLRRGGFRSWNFQHDIKLQLFIVAAIRSGNDGICFDGFPLAMRTTNELERVSARSRDGKIADWLFTARDAYDNHKTRTFLEFENSRKREDEYERAVLYWNNLLPNTQSYTLFLIADTTAIWRRWERAFGAESVRLYQPKNGKYVLRKDGLTQKLHEDLTEYYVHVQKAEWEVINRWLANPTERLYGGLE